MKRQSNRLLSPLSEESMMNLTAEVKEVLARGFTRPQERILSTADLWDIQRRRRPRLQRRFI